MTRPVPLPSYHVWIASVTPSVDPPRLTSLMSAALLTLQNLASSLPTDVWQDHMRTIWPTLFNLPSAYNDNTFPVLGLLLALVDKLDTSQVRLL